MTLLHKQTLSLISQYDPNNPKDPKPKIYRKKKSSKFKRILNPLSSVKAKKVTKKKSARIIIASYQKNFMKNENSWAVYKRTIMQNFMEKLPQSTDMKLYEEYKQMNLKAVEKRHIRKISLRKFPSNFISMKHRPLKYTTVFITHGVSNTFVTIFQAPTRDNDNDTRKVVAKISTGLIGYKGPKKTTIYARKEVIKEAGKLLEDHSTSLLDVIFTSKVWRWNKRVMRDLCQSLCYVTNIVTRYMRSHGFIKHKSKRRK